MASSSSAEAQMKDEIARLTASINQHKLRTASHPGVYRPPSRSNTYVNPNYKPQNKFIRPPANIALPRPAQVRAKPQSSSQIKDVVINGVAFESSARSLVRKDLPKPVSSASSTPQPRPLSRKSGHLMATSRVYKPKSSRRGRPMNRNMTLKNSIRPPQGRRAAKRSKYSNKPCPRFTTTGTCTRGLTCFYQHDASKIAICWNFLHGNCTKTVETCNLSHEPTPERTPLCLHFLNRGRCTRDKCPFPHVNVGARHGICRDFAVLGYCEKGLECDKQHVRECPDFAEKGSCGTKGCRLPHVIRASRTRRSAKTAKSSGSGDETQAAEADSQVSVVAKTDDVPSLPRDGELGDEYISLTFHESESDNESDEEDDEEGEEEEEEEEEDSNDAAERESE